MKLELTVTRAALIIDESPPATITIENDGPDPVDAPNPALHPTLPALRARGPGDEVREHFPEDLLGDRGLRLVPRRRGEQPMEPLAPGERRRIDFELLQRLRLPAPGRYEVEAVLRFPAPNPRTPPPPQVTSPAVALEVAAMDPCWVAPAYGHGGFDEQPLLAWVQRGEPGTVLVRSFALANGRLLPRLSFRVADAPADVRPVISTSPLDAPPRGRVVAWLQGDRVRWAPVGDRAPAEVTLSDAMSRGTASLLGQPFVDPETGLARAFVQQLDGAVRCLRLADEGPLDASSVAMPLAAWSHVAAPARGGPRLLLAARTDGGVELHALAWDDPQRRAIRIGSWKGELAAADAIVDAAGSIRGALLTWFRRRPEAEPQLLGVRWSFDPESGRAVAPPPRACAWDRRLGAPPLRLRVDGRGDPHLLLQDDEGRWLYGTGFGPPQPAFPEDEDGAPLAGSPRPTGPVDVVFGAEGTLPFLLVHEAASGLRLWPLTGEAAPDPDSSEMQQPELEDEEVR